MLLVQPNPSSTVEASKAPALSLDPTPLVAGFIPSSDIVFNPEFPLAHMPSRVAVGQKIFREGEKRAFVYRVESGSVRHWLVKEDGRAELIGFAFPGDLVGLGFLEHYASSAEAVLDTVVTPLPVAEVEALAKTDEQVAERFRDAVELEFEVLRERATAGDASKPLVRLAAYILAVACANDVEHGNGLVVPDGVGCGYVAAQLGLTVDRLAEELATLERRGLVAVSPFGLEVADLSGLEAVID